MSLPPPERLDTDPAVAVAAFRFPSSAPGRTYDAALLIGEDCGEPVTLWDCSCWPFLKVDRCQHVETARQLLANERRAEERQAELDARLGCRHPLTFDEDEPDFAEQVQEVTRAADYNTAACGLTSLPEGGLPMPSFTGTPDLWRSFGALLAAGDRSAVTGGLPADRCADGPTAIMRARRRWAAAARRELRREAQRRLVEAVGLEWPGRLA